ncbi:MAG: thiamine pyrophosphate-binding protein [Gammaproteobacteria bacterium]|nr:thiamine pyrophosphate-binding protein [Gammaproteobacteria bacterium]
MTITEQVSRILRDFGVTVFFGIPGIHNLPFYRVFHGDGHKLVTVRHEQSAAFMADGFARASGRIAGCLLIDGPGFLNAATAIAQARADSIPMIVLTPCGESTESGKLHELTGQATVAQEITRAHTRLDRMTTVTSLGDFLDNSLRLNRPGPIHVEIPLTLLDYDLSAEKDWRPARNEQEITDATLSDAIEVLQSAIQPVVVVGGGVVHAQTELVEFAEMIDAPVINTTNSKGILPSGHRLSVGYSPSFLEIRDLMQEADVVIAIGTELGETDFDFFLTSKNIECQSLIRVDIDPDQISSNATADIGIVGDSQRVLQLFLKHDLRKERAGNERVLRTRALVEKNIHFNNDMYAFLNVIQEQTDILVGDSSQPNYYAQLLYEPDLVRGYFHSVTGFGTLGYSIPATIGAKIARPEKRVACLVGDGGAAFTLSELQTASQLCLGIPFIIWNNEGYGEIDKAMFSESSARYYTSPRPPNFALIAQAFGMNFRQPQNLLQLKDVLAAAYREDTPTIIEVSEQEFMQENQWISWFEESVE